MVRNAWFDYLSNNFTLISKFLISRDSLLGEIFADNNFGSLGNRLSVLY